MWTSLLNMSTMSNLLSLTLPHSTPTFSLLVSANAIGPGWMKAAVSLAGVARVWVHTRASQSEQDTDNQTNQLLLEQFLHRRRKKTEEKAKVLTTAWLGDRIYSIHYCAIAILILQIVLLQSS